MTSDKAYHNVEWEFGYRENDRLGGNDPYSASKACAELFTASMVKSFFPANGHCAIATARAGNVIGGGDWAQDRLVPDIARATQRKQPINIRAPAATRPWQHVLEPISGYIELALRLYDNFDLHGHSFNFGPNQSLNKTVLDLVTEMQSHWADITPQFASDAGPKEASLLQLNCDKAFFHLNWSPRLDFSETVKTTANWYKAFYEIGNNSCSYLLDTDIKNYFDKK